MSLDSRLGPTKSQPTPHTSRTESVGADGSLVEEDGNVRTQLMDCIAALSSAMERMYQRTEEEDQHGDGEAVVEPQAILTEIRRAILREGCIPEEDPPASKESGSTPKTLASADQPCLRGLTWQLLLGVMEVDSQEYVCLVERGPSRLEAAIAKDIKRTLAGEKTFANIGSLTAGTPASAATAPVAAGSQTLGDGSASMVDLATPKSATGMLGSLEGGAALSSSAAAIAATTDARTRLLNAFVHWADDEAQALRKPSPGQPLQPSPVSSAEASILTRGYVQGMGSIAAVLLAVLPEVDAFFSFRSLVTKGVPLWFEPGQRTVRAGCLLADQLLAHCDPQLHRSLIHHYGASSSHADLMFYSRIASLYASRPPLKRVVRLWDAVLAFGVHLLPVLCAAEAHARRDELLAAGRDAITRFQGIGGGGTAAATGVPMASPPSTAGAPSQQQTPGASSSLSSSSSSSAIPAHLDASALVRLSLDIVASLPQPLYARLMEFALAASNVEAADRFASTPAISSVAAASMQHLHMHGSAPSSSSAATIMVAPNQMRSAAAGFSEKPSEEAHAPIAATKTAQGSVKSESNDQEHDEDEQGLRGLIREMAAKSAAAAAGQKGPLSSPTDTAVTDTEQSTVSAPSGGRLDRARQSSRGGHQYHQSHHGIVSPPGGAAMSLRGTDLSLDHSRRQSAATAASRSSSAGPSIPVSASSSSSSSLWDEDDQEDTPSRQQQPAASAGHGRAHKSASSGASTTSLAALLKLKEAVAAAEAAGVFERVERAGIGERRRRSSGGSPAAVEQPTPQQHYSTLARSALAAAAPTTAPAAAPAASSSSEQDALLLQRLDDLDRYARDLALKSRTKEAEREREKEAARREREYYHQQEQDRRRHAGASGSVSGSVRNNPMMTMTTTGPLRTTVSRLGGTMTTSTTKTGAKPSGEPFQDPLVFSRTLREPVIPANYPDPSAFGRPVTRLVGRDDVGWASTTPGATMASTDASLTSSAAQWHWEGSTVRPVGRAGAVSAVFIDPAAATAVASFGSTGYGSMMGRPRDRHNLEILPAGVPSQRPHHSQVQREPPFNLVSQAATSEAWAPAGTLLPPARGSPAHGGAPIAASSSSSSAASSPSGTPSRRTATKVATPTRTTTTTSASVPGSASTSPALHRPSNSPPARLSRGTGGGSPVTASPSSSPSSGTAAALAVAQALGWPIPPSLSAAPPALATATSSSTGALPIAAPASATAATASTIVSTRPKSGVAAAPPPPVSHRPSKSASAGASLDFFGSRSTAAREGVTVTRVIPTTVSKAAPAALSLSAATAASATVRPNPLHTPPPDFTLLLAADEHTRPAAKRHSASSSSAAAAGVAGIHSDGSNAHPHARRGSRSSLPAAAPPRVPVAASSSHIRAPFPAQSYQPYVASSSSPPWAAAGSQHAPSLADVYAGTGLSALMPPPARRK